MTLITAISAEPHIQEIQTQSGLTAWLVESHSIPMVSIEVAFRAGSAFDPKDQAGVAQYTASLLDEGAADMDDRTFKANLERIGARLSAGADKLDLVLNLDTLTQNTDSALALMSDAILHPRFDAEPSERIKASTLAALKRQQEDPASVARLAFNDALYGSHPYAASGLGTEESVKALTSEHAKKYHKAHIHRQNMTISVVGDITPEALSKLLDKHLADIPSSNQQDRNKITEKPAPATPQIQHIERPVPQTTILMGHAGISRDNPDYFPVFVMNHILGSGSFTSRLMQEIREERGLTYGVYSSFAPLPHNGSFVVQLATNNKDAKLAQELVVTELQKMQTAPVTQAEYDDAMSFLTGSFPLRLDSNNKILNYLSAMQMEDLGHDYLETWSDKVKAVTIEDIHAAAKTYLNPGALISITAGGVE